jgi:hypothetical protein
MQNKRLFVTFGLLVAIVGAAAFIVGRMLNQRVGPVGLGMPLGGGDVVSVSIQVTPAPELPTSRPEVTGLYVERKDNSIVLSAVSMEAGGGGVAVGAGSPAELSKGPKKEVVITGETTIYLETTQFSGPPSGETQVLQQTVEEGSLDDLTSQSFVTVWGRQSGDRIIAEVLFISNPVIFKRP